MSFRWKHGAPRVAFISGGSSGIGLEMARRLATGGASIAIFNRKQAPAVVRGLQSLACHRDQQFASYSADVTDTAALQRAIGSATRKFGSPDLAINSAGIQIAKPFDELAQDEFERVVAVNLFGSRNFAAAVLPHMQPGSHLVFVSSLASLTGNFSYTAYCASKFGVRGMAEALRYELRLRDIDVSVCCPGEIETPMVAEERKTMHPISRELKAFAGCNQVGPAVETMLRGIASREFEIVDAFRPRLTAFLSRHLPGVMYGIGEGIVKRVGRDLAAGKAAAR